MVTFEEYQKKQAEKNTSFQLPPPRQVEAAPSNPEWKKFVPLQKEEEDLLKVEGGKRKKATDEKKGKTEQKDTKQKEKVATEFKINTSEDSPKREQRGGRERGGDRSNNNNRGGRGGAAGGRGGRRGGAGGSNKEAPKFSEDAFPALATPNKA